MTEQNSSQKTKNKKDNTTNRFYGAVTAPADRQQHFAGKQQSARNVP
jgi:hypothetical protein